MKTLKSFLSLTIILAYIYVAAPVVIDGISYAMAVAGTNRQLTADEEFKTLIVIIGITAGGFVVGLIVQWLNPLDARQKEVIRRFRKEDLERMLNVKERR